MAILKINGDTSGSVSLTVPAAAGTNTATVPAQTGTLQMLGSGTAVSASGTSVDFTSIPSWVKRITVMFSGVSLSGSANYLIQIGAGSIDTTGYLSTSTYSTNSASSTSGFAILSTLSTYVHSGQIVITNVNSNIWCESHSVTLGSSVSACGGGNKTLSGTLDRIRITTSNGTDTFDAGTINILYEG